MHQTTGQWRLGLILSLTTAFFWGWLPIALKGLLDGLDPITITWYRLLTSALILGIYLHRKGTFKTLHTPDRTITLLIIIAIFGLCGNYILFLFGLDHISPNSATVVIQLAPVFLLVGSILFFKERFVMKQWLGYIILICGLGLFFNERLHELLFEMSDYTVGVLFVLAAAISWAAYALVQKQLLKHYSSGTIMFIIYFTGFIIFSPKAQPGTISDINSAQLFLLLFCIANTLIAYGSFAEALNHLEASRVSTVLAIVPLLTVIFMEISVRVFPGFENSEPLNDLGYIGAVLVVIGSMVSSITSPRDSKEGRELSILTQPSE